MISATFSTFFSTFPSTQPLPLPWDISERVGGGGSQGTDVRRAQLVFFVPLA